MRARLLPSLAASSVLALAMVAACASNDSTTHGFVAANDSGQVSNPGDDDSSIGHVVTGDDDASMLPTGDDDTTPPDATTGDDDDDATTGPGSDGAAGDGGGSTTADASDAAPQHVCDGVIGASEYGDETNGEHSYANAGGTSQTWFMDWDAVNLYIGVNTSPVTEPLVLYLADSAKAATGVSSGYNYDDTQPSSLAVPATFVVYAKYDTSNTTTHFYAEARIATANAWSATPVTTGIQYCFTSSTSQVREIVVPWAVAGAGAGLPKQLSFEGYLENDNSNDLVIYGQIPTANPGGSGGNLTAPAGHRFYVADTSSIAPFLDPL